MAKKATPVPTATDKTHGVETLSVRPWGVDGKCPL